MQWLIEPRPINQATYSHEAYGVLNARLSIGSGDVWDAALVGRKLTDEVYWARASGDNLGSYTSTPTKPLSYAIEASFRW